MKPMNFSVSDKNEDVLKILDKVENKSDFICRAIREKWKNDCYPSADSKDFEEAIKNVLLKLLLNGNLVAAPGGQQMIIDPPAPPEPIKPVDKPPEAQEAPAKADIQEPDEEDSEDENERLTKLADIFNSL